MARKILQPRVDRQWRRPCYPCLEILETRETPAAFTPGNLVIYRVTDGTVSNASEIVLEEYTTTGMLVQSLALPSSGSNAITAEGNATLSGNMTLSSDSQFLVVPGYRKNANASDPSADFSNVTPRVVATVDRNGSIDTSTVLGNAFSQVDFRGAASDGTTLWLSGAGDLDLKGALRDALAGAMTSVGWDETASLNGVGIFDGQLYVAAGDSLGLVDDNDFFAGLPISAGIASYTELINDNPINSFFFADLSSIEAGLDTVYLTSNTLKKYSKVAGVWTLNGSASLPGILNVTGQVNGSSVTLYATSDTTLRTLVDTGGYNANLSTTTFTTLATAAGNNRFRGLAFAPSAAPVNNSPVNILLNEEPLETFEDVSLAIGLAVTDPDAAGAMVHVMFEVSHGSLSLDTNVVGGVSADQVQQSGDTLTVTAPIAAINTTLGGPGLIYNPSLNFAGTDFLVIRTNDLGNTGTPGPRVDQDTVPITVHRDGGIVAVGADAGSQPIVKVYDPDSKELLCQFLAYDANFSGGVRLALGYVNGNFVPVIFTIPGPGIVTEVRVFDANNGMQLNVPLNGVQPFGPLFTQGGFLAAGDVNGDNGIDIVVAPHKLGGGLVRFFNGGTGLQSFSFRPFPKTYKGGIQVAVGNVDTGSPGLEIIVVPTGPLPLGKPSRVRVYSSTGAALSGPGRNFVPLATHKKGYNLTLADLNGTGGIDIIVGTMAGTPRVLLIDSANGQTVQTLTNTTLGLPATYLGPVRVAFVRENDGNIVGLFTAPGSGGPPDLKFFAGITPVLVDSFRPQDGFNGFWIAASL